ncbi:hypothetical protein FACS1894181_14960 [Bacteroidia bacterium]|nr:hypothetical protein FACS1894181_14960 [Bacteroidia bacterium]
MQLTEEERLSIVQSVQGSESSYDPEVKMVTTVINGWNYHTDTLNAVYHHTTGSMGYALSLLDAGTPEYRQRAFDVIEKTISVQETDPNSKYCGIWPYYMEEPCTTKRSPVDRNWAEFMSVTLLDIYMGYKNELPPALIKQIEDALLLASKAIQRRNEGAGYTNIAIMGIYVTYMVSHILDNPELQQYSMFKLHEFYDYTLAKNGFREYNSPNYTLVALDELCRMRQHLVEPEVKKIVDELYYIGWSTIARHYHKPSGQWAGPHSRSYQTLVNKPEVYGLLYRASGGKINLGYEDHSFTRLHHQLPEQLLPYFLNPVYPRIEKEVFENEEPTIEGTCYLTDQYAISSASKASFWNQRRGVVAYWGTPTEPSYLYVRLLHDNYDFSSGHAFNQQKDNTILSLFNFTTNGGDKHIDIDILKDGKFTAKDLRVRFEFGNVDVNLLTLPEKNQPVRLSIDGMQVDIHLFYGVFGTCRGYWEKGSDETHAWLDYVLYAGAEKEFDLTKTDAAAIGYTLRVTADNEPLPEAVEYAVKDGVLSARWNGLETAIPVKPVKRLGQFL